MIIWSASSAEQLIRCTQRDVQAFFYGLGVQCGDGLIGALLLYVQALGNLSSDCENAQNTKFNCFLAWFDFLYRERSTTAADGCKTLDDSRDSDGKIERGTTKLSFPPRQGHILLAPSIPTKVRKRWTWDSHSPENRP